MNSLVLHLIVILLLGSLHMFEYKKDFQLVIAAASISESASKERIILSTLPQPSLLPQHHSISSSASTNSDTATKIMTGKLTHAELKTHIQIPAKATSFTLERSAEFSHANGARQNDSLQSRSRGFRSEAVVGNTNTTKSQKFSKDRRYHVRNINNTDYSNKMGATPSSTAAPNEEPLTASEPTTSRHQMSTLSTNSRKRASHVQQPENVGRQHHNTQAQKTPRMIQRLVAGHIQHTEGRSTFQESSRTGSTPVSNFAAQTPSPLDLSGQQPLSRHSSRLIHSKQISKLLPLITTIAPLPSEFESKVEENTNDSDEALLDEVEAFDNWDSGILRLSAGSGKESASKTTKHKDDSKKTLADQVRDGKYGLIEKELSQAEQRRPGVLSYVPNKEVPSDNESNFGGLNEEDIWLAEDHLLVIKGGTLNDGDDGNKQWPPIDDYDAPERQIKIPLNPKVPPPFPVQLEENGPVQFIGNNKFTVGFPNANESIPVYSTITKANNTPSDSFSEHKKNITPRPGAPQNSYVYPAPSPSWLYQNQTFNNLFLKNTRPVLFPGLGPFPFSRNGSLENSNVPNFFDEDEPSLYYPPAYSFVYSNNYTNPVPPGPLVPGIVLPPPANQFSRLEKPEKIPSTTISPLTRHRVQSTPSPTSSTVSTTSTTAEGLFKQMITNVSEYTPKELNFITPTPEVSSSLRSRPITDLPANSHLRSTPKLIEPIPVPVEVHIPIYPSNNYPKSQSQIVTFVPTTSQPMLYTLSKANPIYYEYFDTKHQSATTNVIKDFLASTVRPPSHIEPVKLYTTSKQPFKSQGLRNHLLPVSSHQNLPQENIVYITPKPEVRYKATLKMSRPLENLEEEVNAIRDTLRYYQNQQLRENNIPRTPITKSIYEYSVDIQKVSQPREPDDRAGSFRPPAEYDDQPFKPMVTYSPPVGDENSFRAIAFDKVDSLRHEEPERQLQPKYQSTTTLVPVRSGSEYINGRRKNLRLDSNYYEQSLKTTFQTNSKPWEGLGKHKYASQVDEIPQKLHDSARLQTAPELLPTHNRVVGGYYYGPPQHQPIRQNNRFFERPFQNSIRKILDYKAQQNLARHQGPVWNLENDTYVNFAPNRPPLNPDAEIVNHYIPPDLSHQLQYYPPLQRIPSLPVSNHQPIPLLRDVVVNYRQPLPSINANSEFIKRPQMVRYQTDQFYRSNSSRNTPQFLQQRQQQSVQSGYRNHPTSRYDITPKYRSATNENNINENTNANNNG